jgi:hypothetical protein
MMAVRLRDAAAHAPMRRLFTRRLVPALATLVFLAALPVRAQDAVPAVPDQGLQALQVLYWHIEEAVRDNDRDKLLEVFSPLLPDQQGQVLVDDLLSTRNTRAVVRERDRIVLPDAPLGTGFRLVTEVFVESGISGRIATYRLDVYRSNPSESTWAIGAVEALNRIDGLYRLVLDDRRQVAVRDLRVTAEDFQLALPSGVAFVARIGEGVSAMVLVGDGTMTFSPRPPAERVQVKLFAGSETLTAPFTMAYLRLNPFDLTTIVNREAFAEEGPADPKIAARATEFFAAQLPRSFSLDLNDLSRETWSLVPGSGDLIADVRTRKYNVLTYARSNNEAEDISVFDRASRRNIAVYPSAARMAARGRTYNEDNLVDYDVTNYFVDATYQPERSWLEGRTQMQVRVRAFALSTLTLRLAEPLVVRSVQSDRHGRLLSIRVRDQNNVLVTFPKPVYRDDVIVLRVSYGGRLEAQPPDREVAGVSAEQMFPPSDMPKIPPEPRWILSNRSYWYPQNTVTDYATGVLRLSVPASYDVAASGDAAPSNPSLAPGTSPTDPGRKTYLFDVPQPTRYFSWLITKLVPAGTMTLLLPDAARGTNEAPEGTRGANGAMPAQQAVPPVFPPGVRYLGMEVMALANPRQIGRARNMLSQAGEILAFYGSLVDDFPYPSFTLAVLDDDLPGGHSPAYLGMVHQPLPTTPFAWRNDPVYFDEYPRFFLAHEVAHQYWGHAVGWKSYHEQWISEGFAQFFALLYAERAGGAGVARSVLARLRSTAMAQSAQGPIELGYRLGHIKSDSRVYRSLIYNKAALVLHMLRQLIGDEAFFAGLRKFYWESRFMKVGTDEVREAFEATSGRALGRFFDRWIREFAIPTVRYSTTVQGDTLVATFEQDANAVHDLPVTVTIRYASGDRQDVVVPLAEASTTARLPLKGPVRGVEVNEDNASLARFERR